jgi:DNA polymerase
VRNVAGRVVLDLETASTVDLTVVGSHVYAEHPDTRITVLCFALDDAPVRSWTGGEPPDDFVAAVATGAIVVAHNYFFEFDVYHAKLVPLGWPPIPLAQWSCTMARALVAGYPARLEAAARAANLTVQKDAGARDLMLRMARPRKLDPLTWWHETDAPRFARLCAYCARDVAAERALDKAVPELSPRERAVFDADHRLNRRGLLVDRPLVDRMHALAVHERARINSRLTRLTNGQVTSGTQVAKLGAWLEFQNVSVPSLARDKIAEMLLTGQYAEPVRDVLQARLDVSRSSTAKLATIQAAASRDGRMRGCFQFYGANRTGRWAGRRFQPQNLPRGTITDVAIAVDLIERGAPPEDLDLLFEDSVMGILASCLRATIAAAPGRTLVAVDLSQIEARVLAWLADQRDVLEVFARGEDVYSYTAQRLGSPSRQLGKVLVLACGFGMGPARFLLTAAAYGLVLTPAQAEDAVMGWRDLNRQIVNYWWEAHKTAMRVVQARAGTMERWGRVTFIRRPRALLARLPSGRHLVYRDPRVIPNPDHGHLEMTYMGIDKGAWMRLRTWPGKLCENSVQAVARDVLADAMVTMDRAGVPLIATVHDELVAEVPTPKAPAALAWMLGVMRRPVPWAPGLPVDAAGFVGQRYRKN